MASICAGGILRPVTEHGADEQRSQKIRDGALPGFVRADLRRHLPPADSAADKIGRGIADPNQDHCEKQKPRARYIHAVETHDGAERKHDE